MILQQKWYPKFFKNIMTGHNGQPLFEEDDPLSESVASIDCRIHLWYTQSSFEQLNQVEFQTIEDLPQSYIISSQNIVVRVVEDESYENLKFQIPETIWNSSSFDLMTGGDHINFATISSIMGSFLMIGISLPNVSLNSNFKLTQNTQNQPRISFW